MKNRDTDRKYRICWLLFTVYLAALAYFLFFAEATGRTGAERVYQYNLIPFHEIRRFWVYRRQLGFMAVALNLAGNVLAFVPFGTFLPLLVRHTRSFWKTMLLGAEFSLLIEILQLFSKVGSFDVDDIMLNTCGVCLGYGLFLAARKFYWRIRSRLASRNGNDKG